MGEPFVPCPHCGAEIRSDASFCRHCGSSDADGWREDEDSYDEMDDFDYDEFVEENFGTSSANTQTPAMWRLVALILLVIFTMGCLLSLM